MNTPTQKSVAVHWPTPPFFKLVETLPPESGRQCTLEFTDGRVRRAELVDFEMAMDSIGLRLAAPPGLKWVEMSKIRSIRLTQPAEYITDAAALDAVGAPALRVDKEKPFESNSAQVVRCFLPVAQIKDVQIGPRLGDVLVEKHDVSAQALEQALSKEATSPTGQSYPRRS